MFFQSTILKFIVYFLCPRKKKRERVEVIEMSSPDKANEARRDLVTEKGERYKTVSHEKGERDKTEVSSQKQANDIRR